MEKENIIYRIPGALYGNSPGFLAHDIKFGNVTVGSEDSVKAIEWLKRRAKIEGIMPAHYEKNAITITYRMKN